MQHTPQQAKAVELLRQWGRLERYPGGYWAAPELPASEFDKVKRARGYISTPTVTALYNRGLVDVAEWRQRSHRRLPRFAYPTQKLIHATVGGPVIPTRQVTQAEIDAYIRAAARRDREDGIE